VNSSSVVRFAILILLLTGLAPAGGRSSTANARVSSQIDVGPNAPSAASQFINGDFEAGRDVGWWVYSENNLTIIADHTNFDAHSGDYFALLGGDDSEHALIRQEITVHLAAPILSYYHRVGSEESLCGYDTASVFVQQESFAPIELCLEGETDGWTEKRLNLSAYAGQTVEIEFVVVTDDFNLSHWAIDDVALERDAGLVYIPMASR
jgi:hypothetical protein